MNQTSRLLGLAFASADVIFEMDSQGAVRFAAGAGIEPGVEPSQSWVGRPLESLIEPAGLEPLAQWLSALSPGVRSQPLDAVFRNDDGRRRKARLRAFILPEQAPAISCAMTWEGPLQAAAKPKTPLDARGLLKRLGELLAQPSFGPETSVAFLDVPGLSGDTDQHRLAAEQIGDTLMQASIGGSSAAQVAPERFAVLSDDHPLTDLIQRVRRAAKAHGLDLDATGTTAAVPPGTDPAIAMRTLRLALDECIKDGPPPSQAFETRLLSTVRDADRFRAIVKSRDFTLAYQPIVSLETGATHHFEALARFRNATTAPIGPIRLAEELNLIGGFDLAVAEKALVQMRKPGAGLVKVAVNASGVSFADDAYVNAILKMTAVSPELRQRLMVEITETSALTDIVGAERRLRALRDAGIRICLDDFGQGAASFDYIRCLTVDIVKIDGAFVKGADADPKSRALITRLVDLCRDLKVSTVAEMIETQADADTVRHLGVDYGQGWLYGRPAAEPVVAAPAASAPKRKGLVSAWG